jgi:hypothetical protein
MTDPCPKCGGKFSDAIWRDGTRWRCSHDWAWGGGRNLDHLWRKCGSCGFVRCEPSKDAVSPPVGRGQKE